MAVDTPVYIAGYYISPHGVRHDTVHDLIYEIAKGALQHAGLQQEKIDALIHTNYDWLDGKGISSLHVVDGLGGNLKEESKVSDDGIYSLFYATLRIRTGLARCVLVAGYAMSSESEPRLFNNLAFDPFYQRPLELDDHIGAAVLAEALVDKSWRTPETGYQLLKALRERGAGNATAHEKKVPSYEEYERSPAVAGFLRQMDLPPDSDGGVALVVCTAEFAEEHGLRPVASIKGFGASTHTHYLGHRLQNILGSFQKACEKALASAECSREKVDFVEFSEPCTYMIGPLLEISGFSSPGKGIEDFLKGSLTVNPSGGNTCAHPTGTAGLLRVAEAVKRLDNAPDGTCALAHGWSGPLMQLNAAVVLEKVS